MSPHALPRILLAALVLGVSAMASSSATAAGAGVLPESCETFLERVGHCAQVLGPSSTLARSYATAHETARAEWMQSSDPAAVGLVCARASAAFDTTAAATRCESDETVAMTTTPSAPR